MTFLFEEFFLPLFQKKPPTEPSLVTNKGVNSNASISIMHPTTFLLLWYDETRLYHT